MLDRGDIGMFNIVPKAILAGKMVKFVELYSTYYDKIFMDNLITIELSNQNFHSRLSVL